MPRLYTQFWPRPLCDSLYLDGLSGETLEYTAGSRRDLAHLRRGDQVYVVTVIRGALYLVGRLTVSDVLTSRDDAEALLGYDPWDTEVHVIGDRIACTRMYFLRPLDADVTARLRFRDSEEGRPLRMRGDGGVDVSALRGVHELDDQSALLLEHALEERWYELPHQPSEDDEDTREDVDAEISDEDYHVILSRLPEGDDRIRIDTVARERALEYYRGHGMTLQRVCSPAVDGCDFLFMHDGEEFRVGVRAVLGPEIAFTLTDLELQTAFDDDRYEMLVVTETLSDEPGLHRFSGRDLDELFDYRSHVYVVRFRSDYGRSVE